MFSDRQELNYEYIESNILNDYKSIIFYQPFKYIAYESHYEPIYPY